MRRKFIRKYRRNRGRYGSKRKRYYRRIKNKRRYRSLRRKVVNMGETKCASFFINAQQVPAAVLPRYG